MSTTDAPAAVDVALEQAGLQLELTGMTCASCANRIERSLNKVPGVEATVNYATEKASVRAAAGAEQLEADALIAAVEKAGYSATLVVPREVSAASGDRPGGAEPVDELRPLRQRLIISAVLTLPVLVLSMVPAWQFLNWPVDFALTHSPLRSPSVWAWPVHRVALVTTRAAFIASMDTLHFRSV